VLTITHLFQHLLASCCWAVAIRILKAGGDLTDKDQYGHHWTKHVNLDTFDHFKDNSMSMSGSAERDHTSEFGQAHKGHESKDTASNLSDGSLVPVRDVITKPMVRRTKKGSSKFSSELPGSIQGRQAIVWQGAANR
jgi:hypothetical protein